MTNEELAVLAKQGDKDAMERLWYQVERLVRMKAYRRMPDDGSTRKYDVDDLMQAGFIGMVKAVGDFEKESGHTFNTYLTYHLKSAFAEVTGTRSTRRDALLTAVSINVPIGSFDGDDCILADTIKDSEAGNEIENMLDRMEVRQAFETVVEQIERLAYPYCDVMTEHYIHGFSMKRIAKKHNFTVVGARNIHNIAIRKLSHTVPIKKMWRELFIDEHTNFYMHIGVQTFQSASGSAVERLAECRDGRRPQVKAN